MGERPARHLLVFDLDSTGHHPGHIQHLARGWHAEPRDGRISVVVAPGFVAQHPSVAAEILGNGSANHGSARVVEVDASEVPRRVAGSGPLPQVARVRSAITEWRTLTRHAAQLGADHCLHMFIDPLLQGPFALRMRAPCPVSGVYFRPTFHYDRLTGAAPLFVDRLRALRQESLLRLAASHPDLGTIFALDPFAVEFMAGWWHGPQVLPLVDPVQVSELPSGAVADLREHLGIEPARRVLLMFGVLTARKGVLEAIEAVRRLPPDIGGGLALVLAGPTSSEDQREQDAAAAALSRDCGVQVVREGFVADEQIQTLFAMADVVLAPYQRHVGASSVLVRSAAAARPVVASDYGLMGELTRRHGLGLAVDSASPAAIAAAIERVLRCGGGTISDVGKMAAFTRASRSEVFAQTLLDRLV